MTRNEREREYKIAFPEFAVPSDSMIKKTKVKGIISSGRGRVSESNRNYQAREIIHTHILVTVSSAKNCMLMLISLTFSGIVNSRPMLVLAVTARV